MGKLITLESDGRLGPEGLNVYVNDDYDQRAGRKTEPAKKATVTKKAPAKRAAKKTVPRKS